MEEDIVCDRVDGMDICEGDDGATESFDWCGNVDGNDRSIYGMELDYWEEENRKIYI